MRLGWKLPLERLSATSLGTFIQCPEQFRQKYLLKTEEKNFGARFMGSVDHDMSRRMAQEKLDKPLTHFSDSVERMYAESWDTVLAESGEPDWRDDDPTKMFKTGVKMSQLYWDEVVSKPDYKPVAVETRVEFTIKGMPSKVVGYVDTMMTDRIRERKTTAVKVTKPKPKWRFQALIYQYATGMPVQWDIVTRQVTPKLYLASEEFPDLYLPLKTPGSTEKLILDTARYMNDLFSRYGSDTPWPTTGIFGDWLCDYCPIGPRYGDSCPIWN